MSNQILPPQFPLEPYPTCFISYSHDDEAHKEWVYNLAEELTKNGILVHVDHWDLEPGDDLNEYMEKKVRESQYVIIVCTPEYKKKADKRERGVGYETRLIGSDFFKKMDRPNKFIPLLSKGSREESIPGYMGDVFYVDFTLPEKCSNSLELLVKYIYGVRTQARPPLGKPPKYISRSQLDDESAEHEYITIESEVRFKLGEETVLVGGGAANSWVVVDVSGLVPENITGLFLQAIPHIRFRGFIDHNYILRHNLSCQIRASKRNNPINIDFIISWANPHYYYLKTDMVRLFQYKLSDPIPDGVDIVLWGYTVENKYPATEKPLLKPLPETPVPPRSE